MDKKTGNILMIIGAILVILGIGLTIYSYRDTGLNGIYVFFWGFVIGGLYIFFKGLDKRWYGK